MAQRYGAETPVLDWRERLVCSKCGSRQIDMVVTGARQIAPGEGGRLGCLGCCLTHRLDIKRAGESYPDCLREEFASRPIERRGLLYQRARNGHRHPGVTFPAELYPRANNRNAPTRFPDAQDFLARGRQSS
jgi:hypothetical protein